MAGNLGLADSLRMTSCLPGPTRVAVARRGRGEGIVTGQGRKAAPPKPVPALSGQEAEDEEIARFYAEHKEALCSYLITGCGCPAADADDIIQDTILAIRKRYWPKVRTSTSRRPTGSRPPNADTAGSLADRPAASTAQIPKRGARRSPPP